MIRLAIRGFAGKAQQWETFVDVEMEQLHDILPNLAERHATAMAAGEITMIQIEFLDEPNPMERFFRIGTDPSGMVMPVMVDLTKGNA